MIHPSIRRARWSTGAECADGQNQRDLGRRHQKNSASDLLIHLNPVNPVQLHPNSAETRRHREEAQDREMLSTGETRD